MINRDEHKARYDLTGTVVVLTGAGGGIGTATTGRLIAGGAQVIAVDRNEESLSHLKESMDAGDQLVTYCVDVSDEAACKSFAAMLAIDHSKVDVLINNAGYFPKCRFEELSYAQWRSIIAINLDSVFLMSQALLPLIRKGEVRRIINIGSSSVFNAPPDYEPYVAAKAGVVGLSRCLARLLGPEDITVNVITPGLSDTPGARTVFQNGEIGATARLRSLSRVQTADDVVGAILFLASKDSSFITGQTINVDGGQRFY